MGGNTQSKSKEPIIIFNEPEVAIRFSHELVDHLQKQRLRSQQQKAPDKTWTLDPESVEQLVQARVTAELERREQLDNEVEQRLGAQLSVLSDSGANAVMTESNIEDLIKRIQRAYNPEISTTMKKQQEAVMTCYSTNKKRTLDCSEQVERFKKAAEEALREFVKKHEMSV